MNKLIVVGMLVAIFCLGVIACDRIKAQPTKWEYQVLNFDEPGGDDHAQDRLNQLGKEGWELVSVQAYEANGVTQNFFAKVCLKRPLAQ
jgi:hypothetical protein